MSFIKGIIENERDLAPSQITFGQLPPNLFQDDSGKWISLDSSIELIETDLGSLLDQELNDE